MTWPILKHRSLSCTEHRCVDRGGCLNLTKNANDSKVTREPCNCSCHVRNDVCKHCGERIRSVGVMNVWVHTLTSKEQCHTKAAPLDMPSNPTLREAYHSLNPTQKVSVNYMLEMAVKEGERNAGNRR